MEPTLETPCEPTKPRTTQVLKLVKLRRFIPKPDDSDLACPWQSPPRLRKSGGLRSSGGVRVGRGGQSEGRCVIALVDNLAR